MYSLAYVLLPHADRDPADAIADALARFRTGLRGDVPDGWLRFHDETADVREMHDARYTFARADGLGISGGESWLLDTRAVTTEMERRGLTSWTVRFADIEPDIDRFAERYVRDLERHPSTRGWGRWANPLGRWDWWDLGGRFDGRITGGRTSVGAQHGPMSSGPNAGRDLVEDLQAGIGERLGVDPPPRIDIAADDNVEMVSTLLEEVRAGRDYALPATLVLPPGSVDDALRWIGSWPAIGPVETVEALGMSAAASWREIVERAYERFADHWAAAVAYHH